MYKLHLIGKYLLKRRIAWVSLLALMLCTTMVLVVINVMGGWLEKFEESARGLSGEVVVIGGSLDGFGHYEPMIERIEALPGVTRAVPAVETFGLINISNTVKKGVQVQGVPLEQYARVTDFDESLLIKQPGFDPDDPFDPDLLDDLDAAMLERHGVPDAMGTLDFDRPMADAIYQNKFPRSRINVLEWEGMIIGTGVAGRIPWPGEPFNRGLGLEGHDVLLTVLESDPDRTGINVDERAEKRFWIVDDSYTGVWQRDNQSVYVDFDVLQELLSMTASEYEDAQTGETRVDPARVSRIDVGLAEGADLITVRDQVRGIVDGVIAEQGAVGRYSIRVDTWRDATGTFLRQVEREKLLMTFLFGIMCLVAVFLIFCIFYMIVMEKTKDIGIIKSVGATGQGVAQIFLGYGLVIGVLGAGSGLLIALAIVRNINAIHGWLGRQFNVQVYDPAAYLFSEIPNTMDPGESAVIVVVAIIASVVGAMVPALRAARMHPVEALRAE